MKDVQILDALPHCQVSNAAQEEQSSIEGNNVAKNEAMRFKPEIDKKSHQKNSSSVKMNYANV